MRHYMFKTTLEEFDDATGQPIFSCREQADGRMLLADHGPISVETVMMLADTAAKAGHDWRALMALVAPERIEAVL